MRIMEHVLVSGHPGKCAACKKETEFWCQQCGRNFCQQCFDRYHHPKLEDP